MRNILKGFGASPPAEEYRFPEASSIQLSAEPTDEAAEDLTEELKPAPRTPESPVHYAKLQAELILRQAREEAELITEQVRADAQLEAELIRSGARDEGYREGYAQGVAQAMGDAVRDREAVAVRLTGQVEEFLAQATQAREELIRQTQGEMLDLCIAVAEKVVRVSLKSSGEVIGRMIQSATERMKRQEWVHIYLSGCDVKGMAQLTPGLTSGLGALSQHVKIVPMADDEGGTCIIETPEEIVDASVSTQLSNIRDLLTNQM